MNCTPHASEHFVRKCALTLKTSKYDTQLSVKRPEASKGWLIIGVFIFKIFLIFRSEAKAYKHKNSITYTDTHTQKHTYVRTSIKSTTNVGLSMLIKSSTLNITYRNKAIYHL
jgi:hypothetical protein